MATLVCSMELENNAYCIEEQSASTGSKWAWPTGDRKWAGPTREGVVSFLLAGLVLPVRHEEVLVEDAGLRRSPSLLLILVLLLVMVVALQQPSAWREQEVILLILILQVSVLRLGGQGFGSLGLLVSTGS